MTGGLAPIYSLAANFQVAQSKQALQTIDKFRDAAKLFEESLNGLKQLLLRVQPLTILCVLADQNLTSFSDVDFPEFQQTHKLSQGHIELLQALISQDALVLAGVLPPLFSDYALATSLLTDIFLAFPLKRLKNGSLPTPKEEVEESIRLHTQGVRNIGYPQQILSMVKGIFGPINNECIRSSKGISFIALADWLFALESLIERRIDAHAQFIFRIASARNKTKILHELKRLYPKHAKSLKKFMRSWSAEKVKTSTCLQSLLESPTVHKLSLDDLVACYPQTIDPPKLAEIADLLSIKPGDETITKTVDHLFMNNPVARRPLLKVEDGWVCPIPNLLIGGCLTVMEGLAEHYGLKKLRKNSVANFSNERQPKYLLQHSRPELSC